MDINLMCPCLLVCLSESMCSVQWDKGGWVGRWVWLLWLPPAHYCVCLFVCLFTCVRIL